jgi:N-acetylmuramoyl-L-alanine amidase
MADFTLSIPAPIEDLPTLAGLVKFWNEEVCKKERAGKSFIYSVVLATDGVAAGKNVVFFKDTESEPLEPKLLKDFPGTLSDDEVENQIAGIEEKENLVVRSYSIVLLGGEKSWVAFFDAAPAVESSNMKTGGGQPTFVPPATGTIGQVTPDHWLSTAARVRVGNGKSLKPLFVVIHYTEGWEASTSIAGWRNRTDGVCAHIIVDRDGKIFQCRPFNEICFHAGGSRWRHPKTGELYNTVNSHGIGIEIANTGDGGDDNLHARLKKGIGIEGLMKAKHRNASVQGSNAADTRKNPRTQWEVYPAVQLDSVFGVVRLLMANYNLVDITGHDCIKFDAKTDPGPAFPMEKLRMENGLSGLPPVWDKTGNKIDV